MTKIITDIETAAEEIRKGNITGLPTETVYGLGADALNDEAVIKIFESKDRPVFNPVIVHIRDVSDIEKYSSDIPDKVYDLAEKFSPGPVTFVLKKKNVISDLVTAGNDSVGLRIPSNHIFREVLRLAGTPVAAPSANRSGRISPTTAEEVLKEMNGKINYILDGGKCEIGIESTVISFLNGGIRILRLGYITKEDIEKVTGKINDKITNDFTDPDSPGNISPGLLKIHYAPATPLYKCNEPEIAGGVTGLQTGILDFSNYQDTKEIAFNLYSDLRRLDESGFDMLLYSEIENTGLGAAINDRLKRAGSGEIILSENSYKIINNKND
ncbi:MAG: threonylcarbamoyl-AMP synthase [Ignavibacteria bacterium]|nr:threonylcarbamoyl-AMP synthase [Ignavibacteria bacterium]